MRPARRGWTIAALVAAVALLVSSAAWAFGGGPGSPASAERWSGHRSMWGDQWSRSADPDLPGTIVDVLAMDMRGRGMMAHRPGLTAGSTAGAMMLRADRVEVAAGTVTLRLVNHGSVDHELVVLPLADGHQVGQRSVGPDGSVDESTSLGEASLTGAEGGGDGISPGTTGWVTLELKPGRYELICNLDGHYAAGMSTLLVVT